MTAYVIDTPMAPPHWALLERELLNANSGAVELFGKRYIDDRGYLAHTPRWGALDGPDYAIETYYNWTLLHALGGSNSVLEVFNPPAVPAEPLVHYSFCYRAASWSKPRQSSFTAV